MKLLKTLLDIVIGLIVLGFGGFVILVNLSSEELSWKLEDVFLSGLLLCFFLVVAGSLVCALRAAHGTWDDDPGSKRLRALYLIPGFSVLVAYWRLRTGKGFAPTAKRKALPWQR